MYIGPYKIKKEESISKDYVKVSFEEHEMNKVKHTTYDDFVSKKLLKKLKTEEPMDFNHVRDVKCDEAAKEVLSILLKFNLKTVEIDYLFQLVKKSIEDSIDLGDEMVWGTDRYNRSMYQINKVLKEK